MVSPPRVALTIVLWPIYSLRHENPKIISHILRIVPQRLRHPEQVSGDRTLCSGTLLGRGSAPGAISTDSTAIFIVVADSHDEEGVVLPRGRGLYGSYVVYLSLPWCVLYVIMSFVI